MNCKEYSSQLEAQCPASLCVHLQNVTLGVRTSPTISQDFMQKSKSVKHAINLVDVSEISPLRKPRSGCVQIIQNEWLSKAVFYFNGQSFVFTSSWMPRRSRFVLVTAPVSIVIESPAQAWTLRLWSFPVLPLPPPHPTPSKPPSGGSLSSI